MNNKGALMALVAKWHKEADEIAANNWTCNSYSIRARADELEQALAETTSQIEKLTQEVGRMAEALWAFPAEPNPYTYRIAHAKARAALAQQEPHHD